MCRKESALDRDRFSWFFCILLRRFILLVRFGLLEREMEMSCKLMGL